MPAATIDDVLARLSGIIADSIRTGDRAGYFAALYYKVTYSVKQGIAAGRFRDGARMEQLDVTFANRYLEAYDGRAAKRPVTESWRVAFTELERPSALVLQHLLLGMNAHINLDLGIATVQVMQGKDLQDIHDDFDTINAIISSLTYQVIHELDRISPLLSILGFHDTQNNSALIQFSIDNARDGAWCFAEALAQTLGDACNACIAARDKDIARLAQSLTHANFFLKVSLMLIHLFEWKDASRITKELNEYRRPVLQAQNVSV
jgi:Family of unknown function (DUF5995)